MNKLFPMCTPLIVGNATFFFPNQILYIKFECLFLNLVNDNLKLQLQLRPHY